MQLRIRARKRVAVQFSAQVECNSITSIWQATDKLTNSVSCRLPGSAVSPLARPIAGLCAWFKHRQDPKLCVQAALHRAACVHRLAVAQASPSCSLLLILNFWAYMAGMHANAAAKPRMPARMPTHTRTRSLSGHCVQLAMNGSKLRISWETGVPCAGAATLLLPSALMSRMSR